MVIVEAQITLIVKKNQTENIESKVYATLFPVGRDEFAAAGQRGFKASFRADIWGFEYGGQPEMVVEGKKMAIYRTYGPKDDGKIELYAGEKVGKA